MSTTVGSKKFWIGGAFALMTLFVGVRTTPAQVPSGPPPGTEAASFPPAPPPGAAGGPPGPAGPPPGGLPPGGPPPEGGLFARFEPQPLPADAPQPSSDPRDFDGVWYHEKMLEFQIRTDIYGYKLPFTPAGQKVAERRYNSLKIGTPYINASALCIPMGHPWQLDLNMPFTIFQSKDRLDWVFEEYHGLVQIALDPAKAPPAGYMGRSVAHWDGDTLVVETTDFTQGIWLDVNGTPASKNAKLTERIRKLKTDHSFLEIVFTLDDPTYYTRPWSWVRDYSWRPDMALYREYNCELQTGAKDGVDPSLVAEPID